jgi:putative DNA primase/helicase
MARFAQVWTISREGPPQIPAIRAPTISSRPQLQQLLEDRSDIGAVVIEPVVAFVNPKDGNAEPEIRRKLRPLAKLAQQYQFAVIGIMHFRKGGDDAAPIHQIAGSLAYGAVARVTYGVVKDKNDPDRRLFLSLGNNFAKSDLGFAYRIREVRVDRQITATAIDWEGPVEITAERAMAKETQPSKAEQAKASLLARLADGPVLPTRLQDEAEGVGLSWRTVIRAAEGIVSKDKEGFQGAWQWSLKGNR